MIVSVNWLKKLSGVDIPIDELTTVIGERLVEVESVKDLGAKYKGILIVKIVECKAVEDSDHLSVTKIDDGGKAENVERDDNGYVQVVCGAPNVREGLMVAWIPPKSIVPMTFDDKEPFVLSAKKLKGLVSNGMLASGKELDLYDDHEGILELPAFAEPGTSFADFTELNDYVLDIENKSLTHRPDTFGIIGFAREVAGILGKKFEYYSWFDNLDPQPETDESVETPKITIDDPELSDRFEAIVLSDITIDSKGPGGMQTYLARSGIRPINTIVDVTNYMMLLSGQPLHAYDYDKLLKVAGGTADIHVRSAKKDEKLELLDGKVITLTKDDIVIAAGDTAVGLAGAMGGASTAIDASTTRILLESATFNLYKMRAIQMRHGIFTEAITRFTKGIPAALGAPVLAESARLLCEVTEAKIVSKIGDAYPGKMDVAPITLTLEDVNDVLGTQFAAEDVSLILENVGFTVEFKGLEATVTVPYWRNDIHIPEDLIEEVGRLSGFDTINLTLPARDFTAVEPDTFDQLREGLRSVLVRSGANEVLTYSFVHGDVMKKAGQNPDQAYRLTNSLSPELQYYRQSLAPSLLQNIHPNIKAGYDHFALFELNKFHTKIHDVTEEGVPKELDGLAFVVARNKKTKGSAYYEAKQYLDYIATSLGIEFAYEPLEEKSDYPVTQPFEPKRSARVWDAQTRERIGVIGEFKRSVQKAFKLPEYTAGFEISPRGLQKSAASVGSRYQPLSKYPGTERDICFQVMSGVMYQQIVDAAHDSFKGSDLIRSIEPVDLYQPEAGDTKNITIRIKLASYERTLTGDEVATVIDNLSEKVVKDLSAKVI